ncbi:ribonuclease D [Candidatus Pelagibacter communis]|uniref:ribonuclease D n=1 Tax=Pelagibacter ubique TaxID=198252 RepID=UPI00094C5F67|nr:ribonuclease D [Candidatus Pelagibacter ubique]
MDIKVHKSDLPEDLEIGNKIAVDCEFMGLNFQRDKLCLVQISTGNSDAHIIQLDRDNYNSPVLKKVLSDKKVKKIFHFARADLTFIKKYLSIDVTNIEDTKLQSKLARSYTDKHGLKDLIKEFIGIDISKQFQSSDFGGQLSQAQIKYCANDVLYLHKINDALNKILIREKRYQLYEECLKFVNTRVNLDLASFSEDIWSH